MSPIHTTHTHTHTSPPPCPDSTLFLCFSLQQNSSKASNTCSTSKSSPLSCSWSHSSQIHAPNSPPKVLLLKSTGTPHNKPSSQVSVWTLMNQAATLDTTVHFFLHDALSTLLRPTAFAPPPVSVASPQSPLPLLPPLSQTLYTGGPELSPWSSSLLSGPSLLCELLQPHAFKYHLHTAGSYMSLPLSLPLPAQHLRW